MLSQMREFPPRTLLQGQSPMSDDFAENDPAWIEACRREEVVRNLLWRLLRQIITPGCRPIPPATFSILRQY